MKNNFKKRLSQLIDQISDIGYNGLYITTDNLSPIPNPKFIVRDINQLYYLSYHYINMDLIDRSTKFFKLINYNIK